MKKVERYIDKLTKVADDMTAEAEGIRMKIDCASDAWLDSDRCAEAEERADALEAAVELVQEAIEELNQVI